jgi:hypothetical protein
VTELHRKSLTRLMQAPSLERKRRQTPRARNSGLEVERLIVRVWESGPPSHDGGKFGPFSFSLDSLLRHSL